MQAWQWVKFNADGTIDLDVSDDPETPDWRHVKRAKVKHLRDYAMQAEAADDVASEFEKRARTEAGLTDEVRDQMVRLMSTDATALTGKDLLEGPDAAEMQRKYVATMQRFLMSNDNPYVAIYRDLLADNELMVEPFVVEDTGDLPLWAFGQDLITMIVSHWQSIPFIPGTGETQPTPAPNRAARRAKPKTNA